MATDLNCRQVELREFLTRGGEGYFTAPRIDQAKLIDTCLGSVIPRAQLREPLEARAAGSFPVLITHDIDHLNESNTAAKVKKMFARDASMARKSRLAASVIKGLGRKDLGFTLDNLLAWHDRMGTKGSFFFISDEVASRSYHDGFYKLDAVNFDALRHHSLGIHTQKSAVSSLDAFLIEKRRIEDVSGRRIRAARSHHLFFHPDKTPDILRDAQIDIDLSIGLNRGIGFPIGSGQPFRVPNGGSTIYVNTNVQDTAIFRHATADPAFALRVVDCCAAMNWPFVVLLHNAWPSRSRVWSWATELIDYALNRGGTPVTVDEYICSLKESATWP